MTTIHLTADRDVCIGSGMCLVYAPGTFDHDDEAKVVVLEPSSDDPEAVRTAVEACPTRALKMLNREVR